MRLDSFTALFAASSCFIGVSAGPLAAKRQDQTSSVTATSSSSVSDSTTSASSTRKAPSVGLVVSTLSDGSFTTFEVVAPQPTGADSESTTSIEEPSKTTYTYSRTGQPLPPSTAFPVCHDANAKPFCLPNNQSTLYVGKTYYATWNPDVFPINSTVTVKVQATNDTSQEVWSSVETDNSWGFVAIETTKDWLHGYSRYNLTFHALNFEGNDPTKKATPYEGPMITITNEPPNHYEPPAPTKVPNKEGLIIGLPVAFGFILLVIIGLFIFKRKDRSIGLGNIMGRRNRGYGVGKSRSQRVGLGKKGAIRLEEREVRPDHGFRDVQSHARGDSLGSLMSADDIQPAPRGNQFRDEIQRQRTGR